MHHSHDREVRRILIGKMSEPTRNLFLYICIFLEPIAVVARSKVWVCGRSFAGIVGSNSAGDMT